MLFLVAVAVYWPALTGAFVWDDDTILTENVLVHAPDGLYRMWLTTQALDYWPVTNSSFWIEWRLWGANPFGYHVTNLVLHVANALLAAAVLRRLRVAGGWMLAILFVVHPVNVESVAWITQRKNTLSLFFFLLSLLWYLRNDEPSHPVPSAPAGRWYWLSVAAFLLAMLSKASVATLPLVLLLFAWWRRGRVTRRDLLRTAPFFAVAGVLTLVNLWFRSHGAAEVIRHATMADRLAGSGAALWFYLYKAILPIHLSFIYPRWNVRSAEFVWWVPLLAAVAVTVGLARWRRHPWARAVLLAWGFFCVTLLPAIGLADVYFMKYSLVADHYQYIALLGVLAPVAALLDGLARRREPKALAARPPSRR